ncbi:HAD family hydrolase [Streptomyces klenkii]|uniref:HAD family hydrolase n=1 Tax=Streptomyces klenkii TaxID=1420899 RepID=UPI0036EDF7E2
MTTRLVLWDIDHTLVDTRGIGQSLFGEAFRAVTGRTMERQARPDGSTDQIIFRETARLHGLTTRHEDFGAFAAALAETHHRRAGELQSAGRALPGAEAALSALSRTGLRQSVVTGNIRPAAAVKLTAFGLAQHLDLAIGAYAEDDEDRASLVAHALRRAARTAADAVLVGDTPADVRAGKHQGVRVVAVATGRSSEQELAAAGADAVLPDLADTPRVIDLLTQATS